MFAVVERAGTVVMNDGEELDSWSVLINGHVEIEYSNGTTEQLHMGDRYVYNEFNFANLYMYLVINE